MGKNKVIQVTLGKDSDDEIKENLSEVSKILSGEKGLLFTNRSVKAAVAELEKISQEEFA
jgi:mRNA turnover protein 4